MCQKAADCGCPQGVGGIQGTFVDDPSGALEEARPAVGQALEARGYPPPERADEAPESRREILREYQATGTEGSESLEDTRGAFNRLTDLLDRLART